MVSGSDKCELIRVFLLRVGVMANVIIRVSNIIIKVRVMLGLG